MWDIVTNFVAFLENLKFKSAQNKISKSLVCLIFTMESTKRVQGVLCLDIA